MEVLLGYICTLVGHMRELLLTILCFMSLSCYAQPCYKQNDGKGLSLFSPFFKSTPRAKVEVPGFSYGDTSTSRLCAGRGKKMVVCSYRFAEPEPIFAIHSGIVNVYTTTSTFEENQGNDAIWINGDSITTNYMGIYPSVQTGQYVYAGQLIGKTYKESNSEELFSFSIRRAKPFNPVVKRGLLPVAPDNNNCECKRDPVWPEYFIYPAGMFIAYDRHNDFMPEGSLCINIEPGGVGKWSFDNGATWLSGGQKIEGLPYGYYRIIFKDEYGYFSTDPVNVRIRPNGKHFETSAQYTPDYTILKRPEAALQREADQKLLNGKFIIALDSFNQVMQANDKTVSIKNSIIDSLNTRFSKIEEVQKETFFLTRLYKYILPVLLLAILFAGILLFQNSKIRRQKKYLESLQKEQHHRVHNSLGLVSSLLNKYKDNIDPEKLANIDNNIIAIATVHRQLYKGDDLGKVDFQPVIEHIAQSLLSQKGFDDRTETNIDAHIIIPQSQSTTLALVFNELFTNSLKYAFENDSDRKISLTANREGNTIVIVYQDNGKGYSAEFLKHKTLGFGRVLLEGLAHQLRAKIHFYNANGACCMIKI